MNRGAPEKKNLVVRWVRYSCEETEEPFMVFPGLIQSPKNEQDRKDAKFIIRLGSLLILCGTLATLRLGTRSQNKSEVLPCYHLRNLVAKTPLSGWLKQ